MIYKPGSVLFVGGDLPAHEEEAKKHIKRHGWTWEQVKLVKRTDTKTGEVEILVIAKLEVEQRGG